MGIVAKNIVKKDKVEQKQPTVINNLNIVKKDKVEQKQPIVINNFAEWRANQVKQENLIEEWKKHLFQ